MEINIAKDFSKTPGSRYPSECDFSGEEFRTKILMPALKKAIGNKEKLIVILDGTAGLGTSFLEESFGGLIRNDKFKYNDIINTIEFVSKNDPDYIDEIYNYLKDADYVENNKK